MRQSWVSVAFVVLTVSIAVLLGIVAGGAVGVLVVSWLIVIVAMIVVRRRLGGADRPVRARPAVSGPWEAYPSYQRIEFSLSWGAHGRSSRALVWRVSRAVLSQCCGIDLDRDPDAARRELGPGPWAALDPEQADIDNAGLDELVTRLTDLATARELGAPGGTEPRP